MVKALGRFFSSENKIHINVEWLWRYSVETFITIPLDVFAFSGYFFKLIFNLFDLTFMLETPK